MMKKSLIITCALFALISIGYAETKSNETEKELGLRKTDLYSEGNETVGDQTKYGKDATGTSTKIERAFTNAPPMIPHDVEGMLPITIKNNQCLSCHDKANAEGMKAGMPNLTAIPASHYKDLRSADQKDLPTLAGARFNCSQCHAPQSETKPLVKNEFTPDFQSDAEKKGSNLAETINIGKDTLK
ncbi:nitrate reductase cytochrome c-type subunit [bacterium]|nr:nitrate reductase cytochrome c-type subunit [bacterium]MBU1957669.1 nitrate reductase cytochrome c-type subunit [bacterium]